MTDAERYGYRALSAARVVVTTEPALEPVSVDDAIGHLNLSGSDYDEDYLANLITAARLKAEADTGRAFITQTVDVYMDGVPCGADIYLPRAPLQSVTSVTTYDDDNVSSVFAASNYLVDTASTPARIALNASATWPSDVRRVNGVVIRAVVGYGSIPLYVPKALQQAILLLVGSLHEHREQVIVSQFAGQFLEVPFGYPQLIAPYLLCLA